MNSVEALKLLDNAFLGDEKSIEYVQFHYDTITTKILNDLEILECFRKIPKQDLKDFIEWQIRYEKNFNIWLKEFVNGPKPIEYEENLNNLLQECDCDLEKEEPIKYLIKIKEWLENE